MRKILIMLGTLLVTLVLVFGACAPTTEPSSTSLPTYSQVLQTYPADIEPCYTEATITEVTEDGGWIIEAEIAEIRDNQILIQYYGAKITTAVPVTIDGKTYPAGTKFTYDKDGNLIEVSSWD